MLPSISCSALKCGYKWRVALPWGKKDENKKLKTVRLAYLHSLKHNFWCVKPSQTKVIIFYKKSYFSVVLFITLWLGHTYNLTDLQWCMSTQLCNRAVRSTILTVRDSRLRPLVTKLNPWVSIATPVRWTCSSMYLQNTVYKSKLTQ